MRSVHMRSRIRGQYIRGEGGKKKPGKSPGGL